MRTNSHKSGVVIATSTTSDGNMSFLYGDHQSVLENRIRFLDSHGVSPDGTVVMGAVHGATVLSVDEHDRTKGFYDGETAPKVDALVTQTENLALFLLTADCLPISFYDMSTRTIALAHLGWKPTDLKLAENVVHYMKSTYRVRTEDIHIYIGPSIKKDSYRTVNPAQATSPEWQPFLGQADDDTTTIDLVAYNTCQLINSGVDPQNITIDDADTFVDTHYYSHRRSREQHKQEGRFATVISLC